MDIYDERLDKLINVIETYRRRLISNSQDYDSVEYISTGNENEKIKAPCCHIIEARRGCGKTTFISKALSGEEDVLPVYVDCQKYNNVKQDPIILEICLNILDELENLLNNDEMIKYERDYFNYTKGFIGFLRKKFNKVDFRIVDEYKSYSYFKKSIELLKTVAFAILEKPEEQVYYCTDSSDNTHSKTSRHKKNKQKEISIGVNVDGGLQVSELVAKIQSVSSYKRVTENVHEEVKENSKIIKVDSQYSKTVKRSDLIDDLKLCFAELFKYIHKKYIKRVVLFLDDFYQIEMECQPRILQYFHGIYKESGGAFCFKAVAIPDSIKINYDGQKLFSKKDDFPSIVLSYDFTNMGRLVDKLVKILVSLDKDINITENEIFSLFTYGTLNYLTMASGGIPRDFMALFSDTLIHARDKNNNPITKSDLYSIISELKKEKESDRDVDLIGFTNEAVDKALTELEKWVNITKTNVMLYPVEAYKKHEKLLKALINLRYIHIINEHVTPEGKNFEAVGVLLDMTLYATSGRLPNNFNMCEFWLKDGHSSELRRAKVNSFKDDYINGLERV